MTASTADSCESPSVGSFASPGVGTPNASIGHIDISKTIEASPMDATEDDASAASSSGDDILSLGELPFGQNFQYGDFQQDEDEDEDELEIKDAFVANTAEASPNDFTMSFSALGVQRKNYRKPSLLDDSVRSATARGVTPVGSSSKFGYEEAFPDAAAQDSFGNLETSVSSFGGGSYVSSRRGSFFETLDEAGLDLDDSARSVPSQDMTRRSSMKRSDSSEVNRRNTIQFVGEIQVYLPGGNTPVVKRRSISFNKNVVIRPIAPATELTDKPHELWVQSEELRRSHKISMDLVANMHNNNSNNDGDDEQGDGNKQEKNSGDDQSSEDCIRGLESLMEADLKLERKYDAWDSVLNEQDLQRSTGTFDDDDIAHAYKYSTAESSQEAVERAKQDEHDVRLYLRGTLVETRRSSM
jgi:hypothetical protein